MILRAYRVARRHAMYVDGKILRVTKKTSHGILFDDLSASY